VSAATVPDEDSLNPTPGVISRRSRI
jgi:hypothetical protein